MLPSSPVEPPLRVKIRPLPKVVFFYLTWIASLVCALAVDDAAPQAWVGGLWVCTFLFNLCVISFDFNEERSLIVGLIVVAGILALLYFGALAEVGSALLSIDPIMNATFYWIMFATFSAVFAVAFLRSRIDYWIIEPNEVIHRYGILKKLKRFSTESLRWDKIVPDLLERVLLGSGTIILTTPHEPHPVVIEHVLFIGRVDRQIARIMGVKQVIASDGRDLEGHT